MTAKPWDAFITDRDRKVFAAAGYGVRGAFPRRPAVLLVDFIAANTELPGFQAAMDKATDLATAARGAGLPVIHVGGAARPDGWDRPGIDGQVFDRDPVRATGLVMAIEPQDIVVRRQAPSGFFDTDLMSFLNLLGADGIVVAGGQTAGAVRATVIDAFSLNLGVTMAADACFDAFEASHALALCDLDAKYADPLETAPILDWIATFPADLFDLPKGAPDRRLNLMPGETT
ncbi:cysteine hydrolase family protein [Chachezhania sediminis]|uniref:cysteine hydrolase family protein n=1 Tax=Chachezhania sediminis TaxID=2599291 RepID=UPI00131EAB7B|nr:isochorismatase family protein [Chachezhania sediminis]